MGSKKENQLSSLHHLYGDAGFDINTVGIFGDNYACAHAYKKTEKLLIALYLVTNFVSEKEPARYAIRDKSVRILSDILHLRSGFRSAGNDQVDQVIASVYEIISLLDVLHAAGFVSDMNLEILKRELSGLITFLQDASGTEVSEKVTFRNDHFKTDEVVQGQGNIKDIIKDSNMQIQREGNKRDTTKTSTHNKGQYTKRTSTSVSHTERRDTILQIIKDKESVNVKDISAVVTDCSEKTIQRELIALVNENVLKKEGERRWSVYSIR